MASPAPNFLHAKLLHGAHQPGAPLNRRRLNPDSLPQPVTYSLTPFFDAKGAKAVGQPSPATCHTPNCCTASSARCAAWSSPSNLDSLPQPSTSTFNLCISKGQPSPQLPTCRMLQDAASQVGRFVGVLQPDFLQAGFPGSRRACPSAGSRPSYCAVQHSEARSTQVYALRTTPTPFQAAAHYYQSHYLATPWESRSVYSFGSARGG